MFGQAALAAGMQLLLAHLHLKPSRHHSSLFLHVVGVEGGHDIRQGMQPVYHIMGLCPQHDLLWDTLSGREHLRFYGTLKGMSGGWAGERWLLCVVLYLVVAVGCCCIYGHVTPVYRDGWLVAHRAGRLGACDSCITRQPCVV